MKPTMQELQNALALVGLFAIAGTLIFAPPPPPSGTLLNMILGGILVFLKGAGAGSSQNPQPPKDPQP